MKYIYILGLPHTGSTFLEMLLSKHDDIMSLGEIRLTIEEIRSGHNPTCSFCMTGTNQCSYWKHLIDEIRESSDLHNAYSVVRARTLKEDNNEEQDNHFYIIDSSKTVTDLMRFYVKDKDDTDARHVKVLYLVRDFRGWTNSIERTYKKNKNKGDRWYESARKYRFGLVVNSYLWLAHHLRTLMILRKNKVEFIPVSYERLIFDTEKELSSIFDFLELERSRFDYASPSLSHNALGNGMRIKFQSSGEIKYNYNYMYDIRHIVYSIILLPVHIVNLRIFKNK